MFMRKILTATLVSAILLTTAPAMAQDAKPAPMVIYDDALKNDWQNWSWGTTLELSVPAGQVKPIKVEGTPWSALDLHHAALSTKGYTRLTFYINGGADGGQQLLVKVKAPGGVAIDSTYAIAPKVKTWAMVEVPLKDIGAEDKMIEDIFFQGAAAAYKPYYITKIQLE
jgi:hypothetical protein